MKPTLHWQEDNFELLEKIGRGGYGSVYKVRNKLDDRIYALKKIKLARVDLQDISDETQKVLKEARTLSLLDHPNILRYYGTWLQHGVESSGTFDSAEKGLRNSDGSYSPDANRAASRPESFLHPLKLTPVPEAAGEQEFYLRNSLRRMGGGQTNITVSAERDSPSNKSFAELESPSLHPSKFDRGSRVYLGRESFTTIEEDDEGYSVGGDSFLQAKPAPNAKKSNEDCLFIQTEYCDLTLESYLDERGKLIKKCQQLHSATYKLLKYDLEVHPLLMYESFSLGLQLISALKYIHSKQNLIHRDLKPSNIFLNNKKSRLEVKLGDFGLVKKLKNVIPDSPFMLQTGADQIPCDDDFVLDEDDKSTGTAEDSKQVDKLIDSQEQETRASTSGQISGFSLSVNGTPLSKEKSPLGQSSFIAKASASQLAPTTSPNTRNRSYILNLTGATGRHNNLGASMLTRSVGTRLYASPEQLESSSYTYKADIFSLGIILLRLFWPTYTHMETMKSVEKMRQGEIRESVSDYFHILAPVLRKTLNKDPKLRPELEELERCLLMEELRIFKELKYKLDSHQAAVFMENPENKILSIGTRTNLLTAQISVENDTVPSHNAPPTNVSKPCILKLHHEEVLVFLEGETKARFSLKLEDYTPLFHMKRKLVSLKHTMKADIHLVFKSPFEVEYFSNFCQDCGCKIY